MSHAKLRAETRLGSGWELACADTTIFELSFMHCFCDTDLCNGAIGRTNGCPECLVLLVLAAVVVATTAKTNSWISD